eukprot:276850-Pelagomonas_calceolata.AAC.1
MELVNPEYVDKACGLKEALLGQVSLNNSFGICVRWKRSFHLHQAQGTKRGQMYTAHKYYGLNAFVAEKYTQQSGDPLNAYYSVAVVKANKCAGESDNGVFSSLESLQ